MATISNVLLITVDDLNYDSVGCFGCPVDDITPNIDRLASEGVRFTNSHVTIAVCQPSRSVLPPSSGTVILPSLSVRPEQRLS